MLQREEHSVRKHYRKIQTTRKLGCTARIYVKEIVKFPEFAVSWHSSCRTIVLSAEYCVVEV